MEDFVQAILVAILVMKAAVQWVEKGYSNLVLLMAFAISALSILFIFARPLSSFFYLELLFSYVDMSLLRNHRSNSCKRSGR